MMSADSAISAKSGCSAPSDVLVQCTSPTAATRINSGIIRDTKDFDVFLISVPQLKPRDFPSSAHQSMTGRVVRASSARQPGVLHAHQRPARPQYVSQTFGSRD